MLDLAGNLLAFTGQKNYFFSFCLKYSFGEIFAISVRVNLTNCSRGIRNAWHFYYALVLVFKVVCGGFGIALLTP